MGNTASFSFSCLSGATSSSKANKTATLLDTQGKIREIKLPVRSGELMIEELGHVIVPVEELRLTKRVSALPAVEELVAGKVYLLVPVSRVHTKATQLEMAIVEKWCNCEKKNKKKKSSSGKRKKASGINMAKVSPVSKNGELLLLEGSNFIISGKLSGGASSSSSSSCDQLRRQARWNPVLEPILESSKDYSLQL
ncbi:hypothetical protein RIF29_22352 [Crotalaria pallida]|uniref:Uncharacterized protein n=1 Tax=Crotalaria pallida TaxID=3830 RepID=A0AAN9I9A6_CROPI